MSNYLSDILWRKHFFLLGVFFLALIALSVSMIFYYYSSKNLTQHSKQLSNVEGRSIAAVENSQLLFKSIQALNQFDQYGIVGEPLRLEWLNTLKLIVEKYNIPSVGFTLNPTQLKSVDEYGAEVDSKLFKTPMVLEMNLMHEGDFYQLLTALKNESKGFFQVDFCELKKIDEDLRDPSDIAQLNANCELTWFNYRDQRREWFGNDV